MSWNTGDALATASHDLTKQNETESCHGAVARAEVIYAVSVILGRMAVFGIWVWHPAVVGDWVIGNSTMSFYPHWGSGITIERTQIWEKWIVAAVCLV